MLTAIFVVLLFLGIAVFDHLTVLKQAGLKAKILHSVILSIGFGILMLDQLDVHIPPPSDAITGAIKAIFHLKS